MFCCTLQVITYVTTIYERESQMIENTYKHIFWTLCCAHVLNNALKEIGKIA